VSVLIPVRIRNYGISSFDRTRILKVNWLYDLPGFRSAARPVKWVANDWQVSGIYIDSTGAPLGVGFATVNTVDITGSPTEGARIDVRSDPSLGHGERNFTRWFRTDVFALPAIGTYGNTARTSIRGPGANNFDVTVFKNFVYKERFRTQLRAEFYNAFNHTQFTGLDTTGRFDAQGRQVNNQFGQITSTRAGRRIQLALRLSF